MHKKSKRFKFGLLSLLENSKPNIPLMVVNGLFSKKMKLITMIGELDWMKRSKKKEN